MSFGVEFSIFFRVDEFWEFSLQVDEDEMSASFSSS